MCLDFLAIILYMDILGYSQSDHVIQSLAGRIIDYFDVCNREHGLILGCVRSPLSTFCIESGR